MAYGHSRNSCSIISTVIAATTSTAFPTGLVTAVSSTVDVASVNRGTVAVASTDTVVVDVASR